LHFSFCTLHFALNKKKKAFIRAARVAHLATADAKGQPHVIPICFVFDGKEFFSPIDEKPKRTAPMKLKRLRNIAENPNVSLVIDRYSEDWRRLAYVLITGKAKVLFRGKKHERTVKSLRSKYAQYRRMAIDERPMIVITPTRFRCWGSFELV
jgi:PPOX class probable F420-dependent enzyme